MEFVTMEDAAEYSFEDDLIFHYGNSGKNLTHEEAVQECARAFSLTYDDAKNRIEAIINE